jgi:hypothetical protein
MGQTATGNWEDGKTWEARIAHVRVKGRAWMEREGPEGAGVT